MTSQTLDPPVAQAAPRSRPLPSTEALSVVLCGSFRRDPNGLAQAHAELSSAFNLLSPVSVQFVDGNAEFVRLPHELDEDTAVIEDRHLAAVTSADFVWLHCPDGYVGTSAAMEIGHARALGIPIFASSAPSDQTLREYVAVVSSASEATALVAAAPGQGLTGLQSYYRRVSERRGWAQETAQDTLLLLTEELGELARAVRKATGLRRDGAYPTVAIENELADVQLYLVHLANTLGVDIADAVTAKEALNARRFSEQRQADVA